MKFSISFKYSNVTFKNKETKETISYDTKAETGNTFTFDNVDEDVVLGIVKGIKDKKASQVFSYDDFRTNFINTLARNKCKELYDKLDKGEWKVEDVSISNVTIKDLEFTRPTMNAREMITVESKKKFKESEDVFDPEEIAKDVTDVFAGQMGWTRFPTTKFIDWLRGTYAFKIMSREDSEYAARKYLEREIYDYIADFMTAKLGFEGDETAAEMSEYFNESKTMINESEEPVIFKRDKHDGEVVAFFPETMFDGSVNRGNIMCYAHNGQSSEASIGYFQDCKPCKDESEYADLLAELEDYFLQDPDNGDIKLKVVRKPSYGRGRTRR